MAFAGPLDRPGWWRRVIVSPDGTLLAQWSGECEIQSTYLLSTRTAVPRPLFRNAMSTALGWSRGGRSIPNRPGC